MICSCSYLLYNPHSPPSKEKKNEKQKQPKQQNNKTSSLTTPKNHSPTKFLVNAKSCDTRKS